MLPTCRRHNGMLSTPVDTDGCQHVLSAILHKHTVELHKHTLVERKLGTSSNSKPPHACSPPYG
jgi:hypothetical protein